MVIAHLPAGYILTSAINRKRPVGKWFWIGLLGCVFPDFDIFYFYLIDNQQTFHRQYLTHLPFFWIGVTFLVMALCSFEMGRKYRLAAVLFLSNVWLHLFMDTLMAPVYWLHPFSAEGFQLLNLNIEKRYDFWLFNYLFSSIMLLEIIFWVVALWVWHRKAKFRRVNRQLSVDETIFNKLNSFFVS